MRISSMEKWNQPDNQMKYIKSVKCKPNCQPAILSFMAKLIYDNICSKITMKTLTVKIVDMNRDYLGETLHFKKKITSKCW